MKLGRNAFFVCIALLPAVSVADVLPLDDALRATYTACVGIDDELADLKKMAGINTAITGVGTGLGAGATVVGIVKANKDKKIADLESRLPNVRESYGQTSYDIDAAKNNLQKAAAANAGTTETEIERLTKQSKSLGNWRTGLMAGATATNIAGAAIAGASLKKGDIQGRIDNCLANVSNLRTSIAKAKTEGIDVREAQTIANACSGYMGQDVSKIQKQAKGSLVSSVIGATTGLTGTVTSAVANTDSDKQKEKNLNTASNVLAGAATVASGTATVFNALRISAIKRLAQTAAECEGALK
ncbi:MAG: hypothetical protein R8N50_02620 [Alphaproteobacteria bacterium]|nr:hypothetical protein [Alphaproteobacteria bacterium]